jgi:hypothetical protein
MNSRLRATLIAASVLPLTLTVSRADVPTAEEDCRNRNSAVCETAGVEFVVDGPCPATARTIRPQGAERCDQARAQVREQSIPMASGSVQARRSSTPRDDLARLGQVERWLLPALLLGGGVLAVVIVAWALRRLYRNRNAGNSVRSAGSSVIQVFAAVTIAVLVAWQAAGAVFQRMFAGFDNHDSAAPVLIAGPVACAVFVMVALLAFAASKWVLRMLGNAFRGNP